MKLTGHHKKHLGILILVMAIAPGLRATDPTAVENSIEQFLAQDDEQHPYRAVRRLEAENGDRKGWVEVITEYSRASGLRYEIVAEGGSGFVRRRVLRAVLEGEREAIAKGETSRSSIDRSNYRFQSNGIDADGLANIRLMPRRDDRVLVNGTMFLRPPDGEIVRLQGRLAKNPSFWVKNVNIVRSYDRIAGVVVPVSLDSTAQLRWFGPATFRMTYQYSEIDGRPVSHEIARTR